MKKLALLLCSLLFLCMAGCGGASKTADKNKPLGLATGPGDGTYQGVGAALVETWNGAKPGFTMETRESGGSVANVELLRQKKADAALVQGDVAYEAVTGTGAFHSRKVENLQQLGTLFWEPVQIVTYQGSGVTTLTDLKDKIIAVGSSGSGSEVAARHILMAAGLTFGDVKVQYLSLTDTIKALREGTVDAAFIAETAPLPALKELAMQKNLVFLPVTEENRGPLSKQNPQYRLGKIPAGTYNGLAADVPAVEIPCLLVATDSLSKEKAAVLVKILLEHPDALQKPLPGFPLLTKENLRKAEAAPWAPGAEQSFQKSKSGS